MYTIVKRLNGTFYCMFRLQDGTEYYNEPTLEAAITHAKKYAQNCNGTKIKKKDIIFLQEQSTAQITLVHWKP